MPINEVINKTNSSHFDFLGMASLLDNIYYYSKDINSKYIECNERLAQTLHLSSLSSIKGKDDQSFGWSKLRTCFLREHDLEVMRSGLAVGKIEDPFMLSNGQQLQLLSYKFPLYIENKLIGIAGISLNINDSNFNNESNIVKFKKMILRHVNQSPISRESNDDLYDSSKLVKILSPREKECLMHYLNGKTSKESAMILGISYRTVEDYFVSIKEKLGCDTKRDLLSLFK